MAAVSKIDGNAAELRIAEELTGYGQLSGSEVWNRYKANSFPEFGGQNTLVARRPITADRQLEKGKITDHNAQGGFQSDLTQENFAKLAEGFFFAAFRTKDELSIADVKQSGVEEDYEPASGGDAYAAGDLLFAQGFDDSANNGLKEVTAAGASSIEVTTSLVAATGQSGTIRRVGFKFATDDLDVDVSGDFATYTTTTKDLTELGLIPGEWIFVGGDTFATQMDNTVNNGFKRVRSVSANALVVDKSSTTMVNETGNGDTVQVFFAPRVVKNEDDSTLIVRKTYQAERQLGAPDDTQPSEIQAEYIAGLVPNTAQFNINTADKMTVDYSFIGKDTSFIDGPTSLKAGTRPTLIGEDAFNTSSDFTRMKVRKVDTANENPSDAVGFLQSLQFTINNNVSALKAIGQVGAFEAVTGAFEVSGSATGYFSDVQLLQDIKDNADFTLDAHAVKENQGISIDMPLIALGDGRPSVEQDAAVTVPLEIQAARGDKVDSALNHTLLMSFWDYLPNAAM